MQCIVYIHIPEEYNNNDKSIVTIFELKVTGKAFAAYVCEFCGAK